MSGVVVKVLRGTAKVAVAVLAAVALLVGVTWMFLQTRRGGELVRRLALPRVNAAIAGTFTLSRFAFGGDRITLEDLALYDPEGHPVASAEAIDVSFSPLALLRRHVDVTRLEIRRPELALVQDERGLNLARALAPRHPSPAAAGDGAPPGSGGARVAIDVRSLVVSDGEIDYRATPSGGASAEQHVRVADLAVRSSAHYAGGRLAADAAVSVRGGRAAVRGAFDTAARRGHATAQASVRGASIAAEGRLDGDAVDAHASIAAEDLARAARALTRDFGLPPIAIAGHGRVDVSCGGTVAAPSLQVAARFPRLAFGDTAARDLTALARVPDLRAPDALEADVRASAIDGGGRKLRSATVTLRATGRHIAAQAAVAAPQPLRIDVAGERQGGRTGRVIAIDAFSLRYPEATWTLRRRARLELGGGAIALSGFELGADAQRLSADLRLGGARRTARVTISRLDLARLPPALVPRDVGLGGTVDAELDLRADQGASPRLAARAALTGGRLHGHRDLSLDVSGHLERGRARGELHARGLGVAAQAHFDLPGAWPPRNLRAPVALTVETGDVDLAALARAIAETAGGPPARLAGHARVAVRLDGRVGEPRLEVDVSGRGLVVDDRRVGDLTLSVNGQGDGGLSARLTSLAPARTRIDVTTPLSLRAILRRPPTAETLARTRFELRGTIDRLPLAVLARAAGGAAPARLRGTLSSTLSVTGTPSEPEGNIAVDVAGAAGDAFPPTDARVEADFERGAVAARVRVVRRQQALVALETRLDAPLGDLLRPARLASAPIHLRAVFGPYLVQRLGLPPLSEREPPRQLAGRAHADLAVDGTVGAPRILLHAQASDMRLDKTELGFAELEARYADRRAQLDARFTSAGGGTLRAQASMTADLGYPAVTRGPNLRRAPFEARLDAQRFDLRGASGAAQALRTVGGLLTASVTVHGPLAAPRFNGRLELTDGALTVSGFGAYSKVHLALHGDERVVTLDELSAASGAGTVRLTGRAARAAGGSGYDVAADARLDKFPIYSQGQALAIVSLAARLNGGAAPGKTRLAVDVDDAHVELKDAKRKDLQPLEVPPDIVLVDAGTPLNKAQGAKLKALLKADQAPAAPAGAHHPPGLRLRVNAPRHLWVNGKDANLELGLSPDFKVSLGDRVEIHGQVTVHRGRVDILGRRFDIKEDSTVTFAGPPDRPVLDVRAEHVNTTENITVLVTAKGTLDKMTVTVTSPNRPDLGESQLYTLIITGHLQFGGAGATSATPSAQAASILGGLLASKIQSTLAHRLPLDVFTIDVGGEGVSGTKLEAGRYVTDRLYAGYIGRVGSDPTRYQNRNAVHLEYQITSRWEIEGEYGDLGTGTADLMWKKNY